MSAAVQSLLSGSHEATPSEEAAAAAAAAASCPLPGEHYSFADVLTVRRALATRLPADLVQQVMLLANVQAMVVVQSQAAVEYLAVQTSDPQTSRRPILTLRGKPPPGFVPTAVTVNVQGHDQGWSSFPEHAGTTENSWTYFELAVNGHTYPRLFTNLHAERKYQLHRAHLFDRADPTRFPPLLGQATADVSLVQCAEFPGWHNFAKDALIAIHYRAPP
jgi:hypothetical protein